MLKTVCQLSSPLASVLDTALCENVCQRSSPLASVLYTILCDSVCLEVYSIQPCVKIIKCFSDLVVSEFLYVLRFPPSMPFQLNVRI